MNGNPGFFMVSSWRRELSSKTCAQVARAQSVQIMCNTSGAYQAQHVMCPVVRMDCSATTNF